MGVCGTGVGALAGMLKQAGYLVTGSDQHVYPPMSDFLAECGIQVLSPYSSSNLEPQPDLVVVGNVITRKNPEARALADLAIPYLSMPQALSCCFIGDKTSLVVTGTHGKTTTSSLLASVLHYVGLTPGFMIGGLVKAFGRNFNVAGGVYFVVEGDEYDTAFFDKGPKFLHYRPQVAIITGIEFDHADIYEDLEAVKVSFRRLVEIMPADGVIVAYLDDPVVREVLRGAACRVLSYGERPEFDWSLSGLKISAGCTDFKVSRSGQIYGEFKNTLPGRHNALNSLAVIAVLDYLGLERQAIASGIESFAGVRRRQEVRGEVGGVTVIDDFAHHPTAVRETLAALRGAYDGRRLITVFEPRTNSSRRRVFQEAYVSCFDDTSLVLIKEPEPLINVVPDERFSARQLVNDLEKREIDAHYFSNTDEIIAYLSKNKRAGDVVVILSNGGFDNIHQRLLDKFQEDLTDPDS
ncbi:MAG: UDP-N-acetylmuramate:L-alanyl-gamma-D-glutamyl-meso-diaminopimelate ligase [Proteobacteria bacterium]|nr:UDP-N-acetylmuramate:L-alanyl-gamma-D-glutamyl-meso-diaminopimelate ligase [Pseudomonadota bacterium]MBU1716180.1 UDP-N-acetylmuramate:L-alanyl-gamma-D-glutamyl-meso-diaminopimelate ligase [Pseudomonadota bacterium]